MNGPSDVRLVLHQEELLAAAQAQSVYGQPPAGATPVRRWQLFWRRLTTRRALLTLTDAQLRDIGLTRGEANREALRPFWTL